MLYQNIYSYGNDSVNWRKLTNVKWHQMTRIDVKIFDASVMTLYDSNDVFWHLLKFYDVLWRFQFLKNWEKYFWRFLTILWRFFWRCRQIWYYYYLTSIDGIWRQIWNLFYFMTIFDGIWRFFTLSIELVKNRQNSSIFKNYCKIIKNFRYYITNYKAFLF